MSALGLVFSWFIMLGYVPDHVDSIYEGLRVKSVESNKSFVTTLGVEASIFEHMKLWGSVETYEYSTGDSAYFLPYRSDYMFGAAIYADGVEIGVKHECDHGVEYTNIPLPWYGSYETQVYLKIGGSTR